MRKRSPLVFDPDKKNAGAPKHQAPASSASAPTPAPAASNAHEDAPSWASCVEHVPPGANKPVLKDRFPERATSGYASALEVTVEHGQGETVLPQGFQAQSSGEGALAEAGFVLPHPDGGAGPTLSTTPNGSGAVTKIGIPVLVLPKTPGRNRMVLPPVPIAVARASGELLTLCTQPHAVLVEDPTASTPDAKPKPNPPPRKTGTPASRMK